MTEASERNAAQHEAPGAIDTPAVSAGGVDFERAVVCILGLPFDAMTVAEAVTRIRRAAREQRRCFLSTPNLNFAVVARSDAAFRDSILRSDLNLVDGMPLVWIARLLGLPIPERVAGSDVFDALQQQDGPAINIYLFGGPPGAAALAGESVNRRGGGLRCVGHDSAGFGSIESMSTDEQIARINRSGADFVIVALGAKKGQAWLEHNASRLTAPVLSHLGAVMNFAAGTLRRAPAWMRWSGLEWLWRVKEEPALWRRYLSDGALAARLLLTRVLPDLWNSRAWRGRPGLPSALQTHELASSIVLRLEGSWRDDNVFALRNALMRASASDRHLRVDLSRVQQVGGSLVALLLVARGWFGARHGFDVVGANRAVEATFRHKMAEHLLAHSE